MEKTALIQFITDYSNTGCKFRPDNGKWNGYIFY